MYAAIGTAWGGSATSFNLPDLRGKFLRGWDHGAGADPDAASRTAANAGGETGDHVGTEEVSAFASHTHSVSDPGHAHTYYNGFQNDGAVGGGHSSPRLVRVVAQVGRRRAGQGQAAESSERRPLTRPSTAAPSSPASKAQTPERYWSAAWVPGYRRSRR